jgi:hypothetical protein
MSFCTTHGTLERWLLSQSDRGLDMMKSNREVLGTMLHSRGEYMQWSCGTKGSRKMYRGFHC